MFAKARIYFTASRDALVAEGDERAAFLYAAPGDEIPADVVEKFGLVDGDLPGEIVVALGADAAEAILRAAAMGAFGPVEIAGLSFTNEFRLFAKGDIDVAQLLDMVTAPELVVEALQFVGDEARDWHPIPGGLEFVRELELTVTTARAIGVEMPRLGETPSDELSLAIEAAKLAAKTAADPETPANDPPPADVLPPVTPPVTGDVAQVPTVEETPVKEAEAPTETKEQAPAENKEEKRGANKGAKGSVKG